jgi:hypothetical protein
VGGGGAIVCILARKQALIPNNAVCPGRTYKDWEAVRENHRGYRKIRIRKIKGFEINKYRFKDQGSS